MLKTKLIENAVCSVVLTYELVEYSYEESLNGFESYAVLHRVQLQPTTATDVLIDCPLDDNDVREHFESMLSDNCCGYSVSTVSEVTA